MHMYIFLVQILVLNSSKMGAVTRLWNIINMEKEQKAQLDCSEHCFKVSGMKFNSIRYKIMHFEARMKASALNWQLKPGNDRRRNNV